MRVCKLLREQKAYCDKPTKLLQSGHKRRSGTYCGGRNLDHVAWSTNYSMKVTSVPDGRLLLCSELQCKFYHSLWRKQVYRLPNIHMEASLLYIGVEARDSLHFLGKDCKKTGEVEIFLFTTWVTNQIKLFTCNNCFRMVLWHCW